MLGRLPLTPYDDPRDAPSYLDLDELLADDRVDAVALDSAVPAVGLLLPVLRAGGRHVLLTAPAPLDPVLLSAPGEGECAVALLRRWEPWARIVPAALAIGGAPRQVTVRGWPSGARSALELVDLVRLWCGDIVAAAAGPAVPVERLPDGAAVTWSLLTASGATVLVSPEGSPDPLLRLTLPAARLDATAGEVRWQGGAALPLVPARSGPDAGLVDVAAALREVLDLPAPGSHEPAAFAGLSDLLAASRTLAALDESGVTGAVVRTD